MPKIDAKEAKIILEGRNQLWNDKATVITDEAVDLFSQDPSYFFSDEDSARASGKECWVQAVAGYFYFKKLTELSDKMAELLSKFQDRDDGEVYQITFGEKLTSLSETAAHWLGQTKGDLTFSAPLNLSDPSWDSLAKLTRNLNLNRQDKLSDTTLEVLAQHKGELGLGGLQNLSDAGAKSLAKHEGCLILGSVEMSETAVLSLKNKLGTIKDWTIDGDEEMSPEDWAAYWLEDN
jgi:hypothetical protein